MTSTPHSLDLGGLAGADAICQAHADAASLPGTYVAYLSPAGVQGHTRLGIARGWIRTDGLPALDEAFDFLNGKMRRPIIFDENGSFMRAPVATGTVAVVAGGAAGETCMDFTSSTSGTLPTGTSDAIGSPGVDDTRDPCSVPSHLYCFGIERNVPLDPEPLAVGRRMFTHLSGLNSGGGLAVFDAACASAASADGLPGTYLALLATSTASAASRFSPGAPWIRSDGAPLTATGADLLGGMILLAPPKGQSSVSVFTGASSPNVPGTLATTCQDWTASAVGDGVTLGNNQFVGPRWFSESQSNCTFDLPVYCLQQ